MSDIESNKDAPGLFNPDTSSDKSELGMKVEKYDGEVSFSSETSLRASSSSGKHDAGMLRRNKLKITWIIVALGCVVSAAFMAMGVVSAKQTTALSFDQRADEIVFHVEATWKIYYMFAKWVKESCDRPSSPELQLSLGGVEMGEDPSHYLGFCNHEEFDKIYNYVVSEGLTFQNLQFIPSITNRGRPYVEAHEVKYYNSKYPQVNATGFTQYVERPAPGQSNFAPSDVRPLYFPYIHNLPVEGNEAAILFDPLSRPFSAPLYERAVTNWEPVMGDRLKLLQETDSNAYSVILRHPGVRGPDSPLVSPSVAQIVVRVPDLLVEFTKGMLDEEEMYLFDTTLKLKAFLGAARHRKQGEVLEMIPELAYENIPRPLRSHFKATEIQVANRRWEVVIVSTNEKPKLTFVVLGGAFIFLASIAIAIWYYKHLSVLEKMATTQTLLTSIFPEAIQDRLLKGEAVTEENKAFKGTRGPELKALMGDNVVPLPTTRPIADLTLEASILFADIAGFTAWSSTREPFQVFTLLEMVFHTFDALAKKRRVYKVETVGDCYVAATGLPEPRKDHAIAMVRFAKDALNSFQLVVRELEVELGPDTADLGIRIGIHSGPVTSGVLRGERPRFQLFGDTMNYASRIETTGKKNRIHLSQETAALVAAAGKPHWISPRNEEVFAKGKGVLKTFWCDGRNDDDKSIRSRNSRASSNSGTAVRVNDLAKKDHVDMKLNRLVDWNTSVLQNLLKKVITRRRAAKIKPDSCEAMETVERAPKKPGQTVFDEVVDVIELPQFDAQSAKEEECPDSIKLDAKIVEQLSKYIRAVTSFYHPDNPFHSYEHATHVIMSVVKLLARIAEPVDLEGVEANASRLHDHTYGITSDPLTQFAVVFSALIHDMDHPGVPNQVLVKEESKEAQFYSNVSVAEQQSVDLAFVILMEDGYVELRRTIYTTVAEYKRFRQLVVNLVLATDVMDKDIGAARKIRWNKAFSGEEASEESLTVATNRKATIVLEHLIQASDVAHTMQHWHIYRKWNEKLFNEMYRTYKQGRSDKNPAEFWYEGEMGFLDYYVIPLANKLKTCGVFGVSSGEYLNYATNNRTEWQNKGKEIVNSLVAAAEEQYARRIEEDDEASIESRT